MKFSSCSYLPLRLSPHSYSLECLNSSASLYFATCLQFFFKFICLGISLFFKFVVYTGMTISLVKIICLNSIVFTIHYYVASSSMPIASITTASCRHIYSIIVSADRNSFYVDCEPHCQGKSYRQHDLDCECDEPSKGCLHIAQNFVLACKVCWFSCWKSSEFGSRKIPTLWLVLLEGLSLHSFAIMPVWYQLMQNGSDEKGFCQLL